MTQNTKIEWCDHTASPWYGCAHVHAGCDHCYAEALAKRSPNTLGVWGNDGTRVRSRSFLAQLLKWDAAAWRAGKIVNVFPSLCDPFEDRPELDSWRREMFDVIDECPNVRLLLLTKRPENVLRMWPVVSATDHETTAHFRDNVCLLTSVSDQTTADALIPDLMKCRDLVPVLGLSCEPLLGPIDIRHWMSGGSSDPSTFVKLLPCLDWVIVGGESGSQARPCDVGWMRDLVEQSSAGDVPCFVKQLGSVPMTTEPSCDALHWPIEVEFSITDDGRRRWPRLLSRKGSDTAEWPDELRVREFPHSFQEA